MTVTPSTPFLGRRFLPLPVSPRVILVTALALLLIILTACGQGGGPEAQAAAEKAKNEQNNEPKPIPVEIAEVARRSIAASYSGTAALEAPQEAQVVAKTSGVLFELLVEEGDRVRAGQLLARIDPERPRLEVARSGAMLRKLEAEYARTKELFERKLIAADAHERVRFDVATQRAAFEMAKLELSYTDVRAPIGGVVARRMVKLGNLITLNMPMFRVVDIDRLEAVLNVPERELATMQQGLAVTMQVDAIPGQPFVGHIARVSPVIDSGTGTFRVTTEFDAQNMLKPGMFGRIEVVFDRRADVLTVPRVALLEGEGEPAVFAVREGKAVRTPVRLGHVNGTYAEVRDGLSEGERVVTVGKVTLRDGTSVDIVNLPATKEADAEEETTDEARIAQAGGGAVASQ